MECLLNHHPPEREFQNIPFNSNEKTCCVSAGKVFMFQKIFKKCMGQLVIKNLLRDQRRCEKKQ
jgi:hypothetical protein